MSNICKTVSLRTRKIKDGHMLSYYLDYYPGYRDESTMKVIRHESLGIYIYAKPKNQMEHKYNLNLTARAEAIRCRRFEAIVNERYDFFDKEKMKGDFLAYFKRLADKKNSKWQHVYMHFRTFTQGKCTFGEINVDLCNRFREYLLTAPQGLHKNRKLHINSAANYWSTFRASIHTAYRDRKIKENPNGFLERIETIPTDKEHLSQDEVIRLASTPCSAPALKRAFPLYLNFPFNKGIKKIANAKRASPRNTTRKDTTIRTINPTKIRLQKTSLLKSSNVLTPFFSFAFLLQS